METMVAALGRELPEWTVERPAGGWSLWISLPAGSAAEFAQAALRHHVMISPGSPCSPDESFPDHVRVCFGMPPPALEEGARRLAAAWREFDPAAVSAEHAGGPLIRVRGSGDAGPGARSGHPACEQRVLGRARRSRSIVAARSSCLVRA